MYKLIRSIAH